MRAPPVPPSAANAAWGRERARTPPPPVTGRLVGTWRRTPRRLGPREQPPTQKDFLSLSGPIPNAPLTHFPDSRRTCLAFLGHRWLSVTASAAVAEAQMTIGHQIKET